MFNKKLELIRYQNKNIFDIISTFSACILFILFCSATTIHAEKNVFQQLENEFKKVVTTSRTNVVKVIATQTKTTQLPGKNNKVQTFFQNISSGIVLDKEGHIATTTFNMKPNRIVVTLNNDMSIPAKILGMDELTDLVVLKTEKKLPMQVKAGNSERIDTGSWVVTIGRSHGVNPIISFGIVSGKETLPAHPCNELIKINAPISPGNSGGAVVNTSGEVVGMILAVLTEPYNQSTFSLELPKQILKQPEITTETKSEFTIPFQLPIDLLNRPEITFAVPIETVKFVASEIIKHGKVPRGWLGVETAPNEIGVIVTSVVTNGPAHKSGILPKDVILEFNSTPIQNFPDLLRCVGSETPNTRIKLKIRRSTHERTYTVKLGER